MSFIVPSTRLQQRPHVEGTEPGCSAGGGEQPAPYPMTRVPRAAVASSLPSHTIQSCPLGAQCLWCAEWPSPGCAPQGRLQGHAEA